MTTPGFLSSDSSNITVNSVTASSVNTDVVSSSSILRVSGAVDGVRIEGKSDQSSDRYQLEEYFKRKPAFNPDIQNAAEATRMIANTDFEVQGTNGATASTSFAGGADAGVLLTTAGADNDQVIIVPHVDANQSAWNLVRWGTENQVDWQCAVRAGAAITTVLYWAGLKLTNVPTIATDADQVFFRFSTDDADTTWHVIDSIGGTDTNTSTSITVTAGTVYRFRISIDSSRVARCYINNILVRTTSALTNDVDLLPFVGVQALAVAARTLTLGYEKISRVLFE